MHTEKSLPLCIFCLQTCIAYNTVAQPHLTRGLGTLTYVKHAFPNLKRKGLQNKNCINIWHGTKRGYPENGKPDSTGGHWAGTLSCTRDAQEAPPEVCPVCEFRARFSHQEQMRCSSLARHLCCTSIPFHHFTVADLSSHGQKHGRTWACINLDNILYPNIGDQFLCFGQSIKCVFSSVAMWPRPTFNPWIFLAWPPIPWDYRCEVQHLACMLYLCTIQCTMNLL